MSYNEFFKRSPAVIMMEKMKDKIEGRCSCGRMPPESYKSHIHNLASDPQQLAEKAIDLVYGQRGKDYGHPYDDYTRTAALWSALIGHEITAEQAALMMVLVKLSREMNRPKDDNIVDAHGYLLVYGRILERINNND